MLWLCFYINRKTFVWVFYRMSVWEKVHLQLEWNSCDFSLFSCMKTLIKSIIYCARLCLWTCRQTSLPFYLTWVSLTIFCFEKCLVGNVCSALRIIVMNRRDNSLVHEILVMAAVELHVNATYHAQHPALKSDYGKDESVIAVKLFSSNRTV